MHRRKKKQSVGNGLWRSVRGKLIGGSWAVVMVVIIYFVVRFITATNASESAAQATINRGQLMQMVLPDNLKSVRCDYRGFTSHFNPDLHIPNVVIYELTVDEADGTLPRYKNFITDDRVEGCATPDDYSYSGYDRGHMAPAGDMKWDKDAMRESFYLSNICPQTQSLNGGDWEDLESACRDWVEDRGVTLHIVCGPLFDSDKPRRLKKHVAVPSGFFKAIICLDKGNEKGIAFIYQNNTDRSRPMSNYVCTIDSVEKLSGFDLFHNVAAKTQQRIEKQADLNDWQ